MEIIVHTLARKDKRVISNELNAAAGGFNSFICVHSLPSDNNELAWIKIKNE